MYCSSGVPCGKCHTALIHTYQGLQCPVCESARPYVNQAPSPAVNSPSYPYPPPPNPLALCQQCGLPVRSAYERCASCGFNPQAVAPLVAEASATITEWTCNSCGQIARTGHFCANSAAPSLPSGSGVWKCRCGYEYNLTQNCLKCGNLNPASCPTVQRTNEYRSIQVNCKVRMNGKCWVCEECGFDQNFVRFTQCKLCKSANVFGKQLQDY